MYMPGATALVGMGGVGEDGGDGGYCGAGKGEDWGRVVVGSGSVLIAMGHRGEDGGAFEAQR